MYYAVINFNTKLTMTDAAVGVMTLPKKLRSDWTTTRNRLGSMAKKRNDLAHLPLITRPSKRAVDRYSLEPAFYYVSADVTVGKPNKRYDRKRLRETRDEFAKLAKQVRRLADQLDAHAPSPDKFP